MPNARTYLIEVFGNLARDTRRQIIESYLDERLDDVMDAFNEDGEEQISER